MIYLKGVQGNESIGKECEKVLRVAICDSDIRYQKQTANILFHTLFDVEDVRFTFYESGARLTRDIMEEKFHQDLLVLDLVLPGSNGLRILELIRNKGLAVDVIVQTEAIELALYGYRFHVFDFIAKPVSVQEAEQVLNRYIREKLHPAEEFLQFSIQGCKQRLRLKNVQFFESRVRKIAAVMENETVEFYRKMDELWKDVGDKGFLRCHQSYIVNKNYVMGLSAGELILFNKKKVPVSRRYAGAVREALEKKNI